MSKDDIIDAWIRDERQELRYRIEDLEEQLEYMEKILHALDVIENYRRDQAEQAMLATQQNPQEGP